MKKFEEAELNVMLVENSIIVTSGCDGSQQKWCGGKVQYDGSTDTPSGGAE